MAHRSAAWLLTVGDTPDYAAILADARMQHQPDPANPNVLLPACSAGAREGLPGRRFVGLARDVAAAGGRASRSSSCGDVGVGVQRFARAIASAAGPGCR